MAVRQMNRDNMLANEDWAGNNAAFTCPSCGRVFIVSGLIHRGTRRCPHCDRSEGRVEGGRESGGTAEIEW